MDNKIQALAKYLEVEDIDELEDIDYLYGLDVFKYGSHEYAIGTEEEAQAAAEDYIKESVWSFNSQWIVDHLDDDFPIEAIKAIQEKYEDGNDALVKIIEKFGDWSYFVKDSILADGRGHFLSSYDGNEEEIYYEGTCYYIYRTN